MCYTYTHTLIMQAVANVEGFKYIEVSAKSGNNVERMFNTVVDGVLEHKTATSQVQDVTVIHLTSDDNDMRSGCCGHC